MDSLDRMLDETLEENAGRYCVTQQPSGVTITLGQLASVPAARRVSQDDATPVGRPYGEPPSDFEVVD